MSPRVRCLIVLVLAAGLAGIAAGLAAVVSDNDEEEERITQATCDQIKIGMTEEQIDVLLGKEWAWRGNGVCYGSCPVAATEESLMEADGAKLTLSFVQDSEKGCLVISGEPVFQASTETRWDWLKRKATRVYERWNLRFL
jgi:hypothetical protein